MRKLTLPFAMLLIASFTLLSSCKKKTYGNTDLNHSTNITLTGWTSDYLTAFNFSFYSSANWDKITQDVMDNGVVLVYGNFYGQWTILPYSVSGTSDTETDMYYNYSYTYSYSLGQVKVYCEGFDDAGSPSASDVMDLPIRVVTLSTHQIDTHPNVDLENYEEVKETFDL